MTRSFAAFERRPGGRSGAWIIGALIALSFNLAVIAFLGFSRFGPLAPAEHPPRHLVLELIPWASTASSTRPRAPASPPTASTSPPPRRRPNSQTGHAGLANPQPSSALGETTTPVRPSAEAAPLDDAAAVRRVLKQIQACNHITPEERAEHLCARAEPVAGTEPSIDPLSVTTRMAFNADQIRREELEATHRELQHMMISASPPSGASGARGSSSGAHYGCIVRGGKTSCSTY